jgi:hypothetical protein
MENTSLMNYEQMQGIMGQIVQVSNTNAQGIAVIMQDLSRLNDLVGGMSTKINNHGDEIVTIKDRMTTLELNEEITEEQANNIRDTANKRVAEILHFDEYEIAKYFRTFICACYKSIKENGGGSSYRRTRKKNYQRVLDVAESWIPSCGIQALKDKVDRKAEAKRLALQNGYEM